MQNVQEYNKFIDDINKEAESNKHDLKDYLLLARDLISILAKYFINADGRISAPSILKFWIYFKMVKELYDKFKEF